MKLALVLLALCSAPAAAGVTSPLLVGDSLEVWASVKGGSTSKTQQGLRMILRGCGCSSAEGWTVLGVKTARAGRLDVLDPRGQYHQPTEPCSRAALQRVMDQLSEAAGSAESWRWFAYWSMDATRATGGRFVALGDTVTLRKVVR